MTLMHQLSTWFRGVSTSALGKWALIPNEQCTAPRCRSGAVAPCVACEEPTCLQHAFLGPDASIVCKLCVDATVEMADEEFEDDDEDEQPAPAPQPPDERRAALREMGLKQGATWQEVQAKFRKLSLKYHPDRQTKKTPAQKERAEEKFKRVTEAYHTLERLMRRAA